jgi:hypothetical protein
MSTYGCRSELNVQCRRIMRLAKHGVLLFGAELLFVVVSYRHFTVPSSEWWAQSHRICPQHSLTCHFRQRNNLILFRPYWKPKRRPLRLFNRRANVSHRATTYFVPLVNVSTSDRVQKLKDARTEALKEIDEYKRAKDAEFKAFEASVSISCNH